MAAELISQANACFVEEEYEHALSLYSQAIAQEPEARPAARPQSLRYFCRVFVVV